MSNNSGQLANIPNGLLLPCLMSFMIRGMSVKLSKSLIRIVIVFFIFNCCLAIIERIFFFNIFPFTGSNPDSDFFDGFRSTALQNHPLNNALISSTIMSFILISRDISNKVRYICIFLGLLAFLCFNTRSSIVIWSVIFFLNSVKVFLSTHKRYRKVKPYLILAASVIICTFLYLLLKEDWGSRLLDTDIQDDGSSMSRLMVFDIFKYYNITDFLFGMSNTGYIEVLKKINLVHLENYWLIFIIRYGLIFTCLITFLYYKLIRRIIRNYSFREKCFFVSLFLILSSTNNSLAFSEQALTFFIICSYAFRPGRNNIISYKI